MNRKIPSCRSLPTFQPESNFCCIFSETGRETLSPGSDPHHSGIHTPEDRSRQGTDGSPHRLVGKNCLEGENGNSYREVILSGGQCGPGVVPHGTPGHQNSDQQKNDTARGAIASAEKKTPVQHQTPAIPPYGCIKIRVIRLLDSPECPLNLVRVFQHVLLKVFLLSKARPRSLDRSQPPYVVRGQRP